MLIRCFLRFGFCKFKYYKDLANQLNYPLPILNQQLGFTPLDKCWVLGYRLKPLIPTTNPPQPQPQSPSPSPSAPPTEQSTQPPAEQIQLQYDPLQKEQVSFGSLQQYAIKHDLDICAANLAEKQVTLVKMRQGIYRKYYQTKLHKIKSTGKKHKEIRVPQNIQDHDILNKVANIRSLVKKGEFKFKIYGENDSQKTQKAVKRLCQFLGRKPKIVIEEFQLQEKLKGQKRIVIERWTTYLDFSEESKVDYDKINRKWKRQLINQKLKAQRENQEQEDFRKVYQGLENEPIEFQRQIIQDLRKQKMPLPAFLSDYESIENLLENNKPSALFDELKKQSKKKFMKTQPLRKMKNQEKEEEVSEEDSEEQENQPDKHDRQKEIDEEIHAVDERVRKDLSPRTVEGILDELDSLKGRKIQMGSFEYNKIKTLQQELKSLLNRNSQKKLL